MRRGFDKTALEGVQIMKLIPLGTYVCCLPGEGCNSSYLIQEDQDNVVLDFGNGAFGNLMTQIGMDEIGAIVISHMHADHFLDLISLGFALLDRNQRGDSLFSIPLYLPKGGSGVLREISKALGHPGFSFTGCGNREFVEKTAQEGDFLFAVYDVREAEDGDVFSVGAFQISCRRVRHGDYTNALLVQSRSGCLFYSADTSICPAVVEAAEGVDLFLCECTIGAKRQESPIHLSAFQAAEIAARAHVEKLLLTHFSSEESVEPSVDAARSIFPKTCAARQLVPVFLERKEK